MKDDFRWVNSVLLDQREAILSKNPELAPQVYNNKDLRPFLDKPAHTKYQDALRQQAAIDNSKAAKLDQKQASSLYVCCPQGNLWLM
jgi:hypothetical protein